MSKGYVFQPSFFELLETFSKPSERDALNMAIHRFMFRGEEPTFTNMELKRAWIGLYPYLSKSRKTSLTMSKDTSNNLPRNFEDTSKILARNSEDTSKKLLSRDKDKEKDIDITPKSPKGNDDDFDKFWKVYPKHIAKQSAKKAFLKIKDVNVDVLIKAVEEQIGWEQWKKDNGAFIPHASTWLNQHRWEDEQKVETEPEVKQKPVPVVNQCPDCGSYDLVHTLDRIICKSCGAFYDYDHTKGIWVRA